MYCCPDLLLLGRYPERFSAPPEWLHAPRRICIIELLLERRVPERVSNNAMRFWIHSCRHCIVVGECDAGKAGEHVFRGDALLYKLIQSGCKIAVHEVSAEAVEGYQDRSWSEK